MFCRCSLTILFRRIVRLSCFDYPIQDYPLSQDSQTILSCIRRCSLTILFRRCTISSDDLFAVKPAMTFPALLPQKPHSKSKTRDHICCLQSCLILWEEGNIQVLLREGRLIQYHLGSSFGHHPDKMMKNCSLFF